MTTMSEMNALKRSFGVFILLFFPLYFYGQEEVDGFDILVIKKSELGKDEPYFVIKAYNTFLQEMWFKSGKNRISFDNSIIVNQPIEPFPLQEEETKGKVFTLPDKISSVDLLRLQGEEAYMAFDMDTINVSFFEPYLRTLELGPPNRDFIRRTEPRKKSIVTNLSFFRVQINTFLARNVNFLCDITLDKYIYNPDWKDQLKNFEFRDCDISTEMRFKGLPLPKYISLLRTDFKTPDAKIDLTHFIIEHPDSICRIRIEDVSDLSRIRFNYENFELVFHDTITHYINIPDWKIELTYKLLLEEQLKQGFLNGYAKLDKEYKEFQYTREKTIYGEFINWIDKTWWDYGYDKSLVVKNSFIVFFFFFVVNLFFYSSLHEVYCPEKFKHLEERLVHKASDKRILKRGILIFINRIPGVFLYTGYLFWAVRLDIHNLEIRKPFAFTLLILEYVSGIICLAYIANYILGR